MRQTVFINERAIDFDRTRVFLYRPLRNKFPLKLSAAMLQQSLKCRANRALMRNTDYLELTQGLVIVLDRLMIWFEVQSFHLQGESLTVTSGLGWNLNSLRSHDK